MEIKNLSQLKRALKEGHNFQIVKHVNCPDSIGQIRQVNVLQTNGIYTIDAKNPNNPINKVNHGRGSWLEYGKASDWDFSNGVCELKNVWSIKVI